MSPIIHEIAAEFLENILEALNPHEGMNWEKTSAKLMQYCKETTARFLRAAATVRNCIMRVNVPETVVPEAKRKVNVLHVFADEDHVHMQKAENRPGKRISTTGVSLMESLLSWTELPRLRC
ncbi:MAG: hypothetical protein ACI4W2_08645 [Eubacterium sp.]